MKPTVKEQAKKHDFLELTLHLYPDIHCALYMLCSYRYCIDSLICCLHRETWPLNPPEVHEAVLQFAGWGPRGQQLVRMPYPRDYTHLIVAYLSESAWHSSDLWFVTVEQTNVEAIRGLCTL